jgi:transcriptional regulator with XRE-family HTH domain
VATERFEWHGAVMTNGSNGTGGLGAAPRVRRALGRRLKALRESSGKTHEDVRAAGVGSRQKLWNMEKGKGVLRPGDVRELCNLYGVGVDQTEEMVEQARQTAGGKIFEEYTDAIPRWFGTYVLLEATASTIYTYQPELMPGLLQTPDYARGVHRPGIPALSEAEIERLVEIRIRRQAGVIEAPEGARIVAVLSEAVLARLVGGPEVMAAQLEHLRDLSQNRRVEVRVLTYASGAHASMKGSFTVLEFEDDQEETEDRVVYVESHAGARYLEQPKQIQDYLAIWQSISEQSIPMEEYAP